MLEQLERANLFIVALDTQRLWYRYHALFAQAVRHRLEQTQPALVPILYDRASRWYARQGRLNEAIAHAITARQWLWAADLIEQVYTSIWGNSQHARLRRWLEQLPAEVMCTRPRLCLAYAKTAFMVAPYTTVERWLHDAEIALRSTAPAATPASISEAAEGGESSTQQERDDLLGAIAAQRAIITGYYLGKGHAVLTFCQEALAHLSEQNLLARAEVAYARSLAYHSFGDIVASIQSTKEATALAQAAGDTSSTIIYQCRTAYCLLAHGKLHEVVQITRQAARLGSTPAGLPHAMTCWASLFQADALREWNRLDEALDVALQGVRLSEQTETIVALYLGYTILMRIYLAQGEMDAARLAFQRAEEALMKTYSPYRRDAYLIVNWVQFWLASGEMERALNWLQEIAPHPSAPSPSTNEHSPLAHERALLRNQERKQGPPPYLDELLDAFSSEHITHSSPPSTSRQPKGHLLEQPLIEPLSERELEVLHLIARGDSNQEIAEILVIAVVTVKRHVTHIFEKLGVNNRMQAVVRARSLGLLTDET